MKWQVKAQGDDSVDIHINDIIGDWIDDYFGFGVTSKAFIKDLDDLSASVKNIRLHVNSPGGDVSAASHIANALRDQQAKGRKVEVLIEGAAFSAATIITSAGNPTKMADNALMMIHDPWTITLGNARELRKDADVLDKFRDTIVAAYKWKSPLDADELIELMAADTWMDVDEAIKNGFVDEKIEGLKAAACLDATLLKKIPPVPEKYKDRVQALLKAEKPAPDPDPQPEPQPDPAPSPTEAEVEAKVKEAEARARQIVELCAKAGVADAAADFLVKGLSVDDVKKKLADSDKIRARCAAAKLPGRANGYIKAGMTVGEVANDLFDVLIARQGPEIDNKLRPEGERRNPSPAPVIDINAIYRKRNQRK